MHPTSIARPWLAVAALAAALAAPSLAHAGSGRVVVMPFEGPSELADDTRAQIVSQVSRTYDIVAPTSWVKARRAAEDQEFGAKVWARAAKKAKVDAVVEGKVVLRGKKAALELTVIDAHAGTEVDRTEIPMATSGLDRRAEDRVRQELVDLLGWVDGVSSTRAVGDADLTDLDDLRDLDGDRGDGDDRDRRDRRDRDERRIVRDRDRDRDERDARDRDDGDRDDADRDDRDRDRDRDERRIDRDDDADADADADAEASDDAGDRDDDRDDDRAPGDDRDDDHRSRRGDDIMALFGDGPALSPADSTRAADRAHRAAAGARMFAADASLAAFGRSRTFLGGPDAPLDYPGGTTKALVLSAAVYPTSKDPRGRFAGVGVSVEYARGVASTAAVDIGEDAPVDYDVDYQEWAAAAHYRLNTRDLSIDGAVGYRSVTHVLDVIDELDDRTGAEVDALDGEFGSLTAGGRIEFAASPRATIGVGAEYLYVTSIGAISETSMLGGGQAWGARAQADVRFTLSRSMFVHAAATLSHYTVDFDGTGDMDTDWQVDTMSDSFVGGQLGLGVSY